MSGIGSQKQKNVTTYALSPNRQRPLAGTAHAAVFNVFRRTRHQILYWLPPLLIGYATMQWATERYVNPGARDNKSSEYTEYVVSATAIVSLRKASFTDQTITETNILTRSLDVRPKLHRKWTVSPHKDLVLCSIHKRRSSSKFRNGTLLNPIGFD